MQVIEKVKVVPEGYNGAGMDGYGRRDVNGKANASAVDFWFEDDDFDGNKVWKYFNEM